MTTYRVDVCPGCDQPFEQELKRGRPRTYCSPVCAGNGAKEADRAWKAQRKKPRASSEERPDALPRLVALGLRPDPPVRPDGLCVVCLSPRKITKEARRYAGAQIDIDPFCSNRCCRRFHGCEIVGDDGEYDHLAEAARERNEQRKREKAAA